MLLRLVSRIAAVSAFTAARMSSEFRVRREKFTVFPNAVDPLSTHSERPSAEPRLLTVARLSAHDYGKHHDSVLRALPEILVRIPRTRYKIVGDGALRPKLQALAAQLGVAESVDFAGRLSGADLAQAYAESTLFVMPSEKEGFGIVFLEAWLRGIPVICGTEDASHEVVTHGVDGYAVHHSDIAGLAEKITLLLRDPDRAAAMGRAGREKVASTYTMAHFTANLNALLAEVRA